MPSCGAAVAEITRTGWEKTRAILRHDRQLRVYLQERAPSSDLHSACIDAPMRVEREGMNPVTLLREVVLPAAILFAAAFALPHVAELPPTLAGIKIYGPHFVLALGMLLALAFRRGRILFAIMTLAIAYTAFGVIVLDGLTGFRAHTLFAAAGFFVPLNLTLLCVATERGIFNIYGLQRLGVLVVEVLITLWILYAPVTLITAWAMAPIIDTTLFAASPIRQLSVLALMTGIGVTLAVWLIKRRSIDIAFAAALFCFALAMDLVGRPHAFALYIAAGALVFTIALLQDTFRMAFRDELTGLPSRRSLNERMLGLGRRYTIAMCDIDHFKQFNDTHGHDLGDQVLKLVAAKLAAVDGGGTAFRYGGEEFTVLFPGKDMTHAVRHLEALRGAIEAYKIALRAPNRPDKPEPSTRRRGSYREIKSVSVTISIGVAERSAKLATPDDVIKAADKALYRAKSKGRNRVSR
jgi:GGDEF domain-containing protein